MRFLLDTHIWLWALLEPEKLSPDVATVLENEENELFLSPISVWEVLILSEKGRIDIGPSPQDWIAKAIAGSSVKEAAMTHEIAIRSRSLALTRQDPADRFIAATAAEYDLILVTSDRVLRESTEIDIF